MSVRCPRVASPGLDSGLGEELLGSRWRLLTDLNFAVDDDEASAETLLKAFDLSIYDCDLKLQTATSDTQAELTHDSFTDLPPSSSQNPFLSTPLRLKHFSKLSPSILRALLRSPSLRSPSFGDDSLDSAPNSNSLSPLGSPGSQWRPNNSPLVNADADVRSPEPSLPLTPPPTARIPFSQLPNPYSASPSVPRRQDTTNGALTTVFPAPPPDSLISPSAVRNFQRVIDEMKGVDSSFAAPEELPAIDDEISFFLLSSPHLSSPPGGGLLTPETDTHDAISPFTPPSKDLTLGALEDEFMNLLLGRAKEEEEDAEELRALADRLVRMAKGRRHLAATIMERKNAEQNRKK
ncbi:hypothetical protein K438DRAFT_2010905 [Mycena galopus ATCC 62051]|nr:hypothetical protein K438DRAFT_2010905 [Mycena galopus ATCC 62051]